MVLLSDYNAPVIIPSFAAKRKGLSLIIGIFFNRFSLVGNGSQPFRIHYAVGNGSQPFRLLSHGYISL